jgi:hypothetical protein
MKVEERLLKIRNRGRRHGNYVGGVTRQDIKDLLTDIGKPGQKRKEKLEAVAELQLSNNQGISLEEDLSSYPEF